MTFAECISPLLKGFHIRKPHFNSGHYVAINRNNHDILSYFYSDRVEVYEITSEDLSDLCWEVIKWDSQSENLET